MVQEGLGRHLILWRCQEIWEVKELIDPGRLWLSVTVFYLFIYFFTNWIFYWHFVISSSQGRTLKSAGWDFSIGESEGTGTFRSVSRPPQFRDKKTDVSYNQLTQRKAPDSGYQGRSANRSESSFGKDLRVPYDDEHLDNHLEDVTDSYYTYLSLLQKLT